MTIVEQLHLPRVAEQSSVGDEALQTRDITCDSDSGESILCAIKNSHLLWAKRVKKLWRVSGNQKLSLHRSD